MILTRPVRYLALVNERGWPLILRNLLPTLVVAAVLAVPFILIKRANFFGAAGFVEKAGTFSSVLTGFYIAALVAVATFAASLGDLDTPIGVGKVIEKGRNGDPDQELSRREYVCALFGYLAFLSLVISIASILLVVVSTPVGAGMKTLLTSRHYAWVRGAAVVAYSLLLASLLIHTLHGLYYLVERLYAGKPKIRPKKSS